MECMPSSLPLLICLLVVSSVSLITLTVAQPLQLPVVPEFYPVDGRAGVKPLANQIAGRGTEFSLPQINAKAYRQRQRHVGYGLPSGHTSTIPSNKSTSHSRFLPSIYDKPPPNGKVGALTAVSANMHSN